MIDKYRSTLSFNKIIFILVSYQLVILYVLYSLINPDSFWHYYTNNYRYVALIVFIFLFICGGGGVIGLFLISFKNLSKNEQLILNYNKTRHNIKKIIVIVLILTQIIEILCLAFFLLFGVVGYIFNGAALDSF